MDYLHQEMDLAEDDVVEVTLDHPANVVLLDPENWHAYQERQPFRYARGGHTAQRSVRLQAPQPGKWHLVIDLGGGFGRVRAFAKIFSEAAVS